MEERGVAQSFVLFFNDTATAEIYTLSLHDALPIWWRGPASFSSDGGLFVRQRLSSEPERYRGRRRVPTPPRSRYAGVVTSAFVGAGVVALGAASHLPDAKAVNPAVLAGLDDS